MVIQNFLDYISKEKRFSNHTKIAYQNDLTSFDAFCKEEFDEEIEAATSKMIRLWFSSLRRKSSALKSFYKFLMKAGKIDSSPVEGTPLPKISNRLPKFVEEKSMSELLNELEFEDSFASQSEKLIIDLLYQTGMRLSELINLKVADIDFHLQQLKVIGKRNKERVIPFSKQLSETIKNFLAYRKIQSEYLVTTEKGQQAYPKYIYRKVNLCLKRVSTISQKSPHVLRHTFATHLLNNGAELNAIKEVLGHANLSATEVYTHNSLEKIKSVYKQAHPRA